MIVLDASVAVEFLLQTRRGRLIETRIYSRSETLHSPHLLDLEAVQVLRRFARAGTLSERRADEAVRDLVDLQITRYPHDVFVSRIWGWRHNLSAYDASYVVLAEELKATLLTLDNRLASAVKSGIHVEVF